MENFQKKLENVILEIFDTVKIEDADLAKRLNELIEEINSKES